MFVNPQLEALQQGLGYEFSKPELITEALTHRSHHHENGDSPHNERLEFLGDAVLDLIVTELVMRLSPLTDEGNLSKIRSQLVSEESLASIARKIHLGSFVRLGKGEDQSGGRIRDSLLGDTFEAIIAAIYLDGGIEAARKTLEQLFTVELSSTESWEVKSLKLITQDSKSLLQEFFQSLGLGAPTYNCVETRGPDHSKRFVMGVTLQGKELGRSEGSTKKEATQKAARELIELGKPHLIRLLQENGFNSKTIKTAIQENTLSGFFTQESQL